MHWCESVSAACTMQWPFICVGLRRIPFSFSRGTKCKCNMVSVDACSRDRFTCAGKCTCVKFWFSSLCGGRAQFSYVRPRSCVCSCVCSSAQNWYRLATWANISCNICLIFIYRTCNCIIVWQRILSFAIIEMNSSRPVAACALVSAQ